MDSLAFIGLLLPLRTYKLSLNLFGIHYVPVMFYKHLRIKNLVNNYTCAWKVINYIIINPAHLFAYFNTFTQIQKDPYMKVLEKQTIEM